MSNRKSTIIISTAIAQWFSSLIQFGALGITTYEKLLTKAQTKRQLNVLVNASFLLPFMVGFSAFLKF